MRIIGGEYKSRSMVVAVIGKGLTRKQADKRIETGLSRINMADYFINDVEE